MRWLKSICWHHWHPYTLAGQRFQTTRRIPRKPWPWECPSRAAKGMTELLFECCKCKERKWS